MPRKKKGPIISPVALLVTAGCLLIAGQVMKFLSRNGGSILLVFFFVLVLAIVGFVVIPIWRQRILLDQVSAKTDEHIDALIRQRVTLIRNDPYGKPILDKWHSHLNYFLTHHVRSALSSSQQLLLDRHKPIILQHIAQRVADAGQQRPPFATIPARMTPAEFEAYCAESLRGFGWEVLLTPMSRDQGVDVIAQKNGVRVVLQCKLYAQPVGNKAVQEVAAGRAHQQAHYGAVVTNGAYTTPARELAATNGILLLHYTELPQLEQILSRPAVH